MPSGFYYHTEEFDTDEFAGKCSDRLEDLPQNPDDVALRTKKAVDPQDFFDSNLTADWKAANYGDNIVEFDVPYTELNDESREREMEVLSTSYGQFFIVELDVHADSEQHKCSALIEIRGRAREGKTEFFIQELISGEAGV
ncbi:hypothetical protein [Haloarcula sp. K1]|uniref:hypothetical protein n=1 Tax=Haloarcula sp. K1 TaxID=1622207 RepID=UPI0007BBC328|nr:hypothetical protein [Haloarcula sp. K1]KZX46322.1 hypothetical protein AV929_16255 [Haloarcula sp. K1]